MGGHNYESISTSITLELNPNERNIADGAVIAAGSIVTKDVNSYTIVARNMSEIYRIQ